MELKNLNTCLNCENLIRDFVCKKHNKEVDITNVCDSHIYKASIQKLLHVLIVFILEKIVVLILLRLVLECFVLIGENNIK